tara:strand:- start:1103 stop:1522 length:420 start_codon:yes stop_codon:yes gene_type:complete
MILRRTKGGYEPADSESAEVALKHEAGELVECKITRKRNIKFSRKFWAMVNLVAHNQDKIEFSTNAQGSHRLIYAACHILHLGTFWGKDKQHFERKSFAFHNMKEDEFEECYNQILDCFLKHFVPMGKDDFERELLGFG